MNPPPVVVGLSLCERVIIEEGTKNLTLVNTFTIRKLAQFPSPPQQFVVAAILTDGLGPGEIEVVVRSMDSNLEIDVIRGRVIFPDRLMEVRMLFRVEECRFPAPGSYEAVLTVDGEWIAHRSFKVVQK